MSSDFIANAYNPQLPPTQVFLIFDTDKEYHDMIKVETQRDSFGDMVVYWTDIMNLQENAIYLKDNKGMVAAFVKDNTTSETRVPLRVLYSKDPLTIIVHKPPVDHVVLPLSKGLRIEPERTLSASTRIRKNLYRALFRVNSVPIAPLESTSTHHHQTTTTTTPMTSKSADSQPQDLTKDLNKTIPLPPTKSLPPLPASQMPPTAVHRAWETSRKYPLFPLFPNRRTHLFDISSSPSSDANSSPKAVFSQQIATSASGKARDSEVEQRSIRPLTPAVQETVRLSAEYGRSIVTSAATSPGFESTVINKHDGPYDQGAMTQQIAQEVWKLQKQMKVKDENKGVRSGAAAALGKQSTLSESAVQSLIASLKGKDEDVRSSAALALGKRSTLPESAIQSLIVALKDEDSYVRTSVASALCKQSTLPESAIQSLIAELKDEHSYVRSSAALALGKQSTLPESAIQSLIAVLKDEHSYVRTSVASALCKQSTLPESAIQSLIAALKDKHSYVRSSAASALGKQSLLPESAIQSLIAALKDEYSSVRSSAASALGKQSTLPESAIQSLIAARKDEDSYVRSLATSALGNHVAF